MLAPVLVVLPCHFLFGAQHVATLQVTQAALQQKATWLQSSLNAAQQAHARALDNVDAQFASLEELVRESRSEVRKERLTAAAVPAADNVAATVSQLQQQLLDERRKSQHVANRMQEAADTQQQLEAEVRRLSKQVEETCTTVPCEAPTYSEHRLKTLLHDEQIRSSVLENQLSEKDKQLKQSSGWKGAHQVEQLARQVQLLEQKLHHTKTKAKAAAATQEELRDEVARLQHEQGLTAGIESLMQKKLDRARRTEVKLSQQVASFQQRADSQLARQEQQDRAMDKLVQQHNADLIKQQNLSQQVNQLQASLSKQVSSHDLLVIKSKQLSLRLLTERRNGQQLKEQLADETDEVVRLQEKLSHGQDLIRGVQAAYESEAATLHRELANLRHLHNM